MKIALDIGHTSGKDQGAVSKSGLSEHAFWRQYAPMLRQLIINAGHGCQIFRREDHGGTVAKECAAINSYGADIAISLHLNSALSPACKGGHEIVHYDGSTRGKTLAWSLDSEFDKLTWLADRNIRTPYEGRGDAFLSGTKCPAVIVEAAFLSVDNDVANLNNPARAEAICHAIVAGINSYAKGDQAK